MMQLSKNPTIYFMIYCFSDARVSRTLEAPGVRTNRETGKVDCQMTKYCHGQINHKAYWNKSQHFCLPKAGAAGNSVDTGEMVNCCEGKGGGSR